jgi:uncharacterized surface protein with fasciclin (FAS1) repeats
MNRYLKRLPALLAMIALAACGAAPVTSSSTVTGATEPALASPTSALPEIGPTEPLTGTAMMNGTSMSGTEMTTETAITTDTTGTSTTGTAAPSGNSGSTAVDLATALRNDGRLNTLAVALQAAGLDTALQAAGPYTIFAPTDSAFAALPAGSLDKLLADPTQLSAVLSNHLVKDKLLAADVAKATQLTTLGGQTLQVTTDGSGQVMLNNQARILTTDIQTDSGVIHVIDAVLLPQMSS